jgi:hypothetical protein
MQTLPLGLAGAAAATPLAQRQSETDQAQHEAASHARQASGEKQAENASGIGQTDEDQPAFDRDADGRRIWEIRAPREKEDDEAVPEPTQAKDTTGEVGGQLDLSG